MIRHAFAATVLLLATPLSAQSAQEQLQTRYDRALAAGYKALFLCSAIANAERAGESRTPESVEKWELTGIQQPLDTIIRDLSYRIVRSVGDEEGPIVYVAVSWAEDAPDRIARHVPGNGCIVLPIGMEDTGGTDTRIGANETPLIAFGVPAPPASATNEVVGAAFDGSYGEASRTTAVIVRQNGKPVDWETVPGFTLFTPQRTWSVAKSIAATLIGAAVQRGEAVVTESAGLGEDETDPRKDITIDHLLRMASGRYSDTPGNRTDPLYFGGSTVEETALHWPLIEQPGTSFRYANNDTLAAVKAIEGTFAAHPPAELFAKLGMKYTIAETDWQGDYILSSQVWSTADDLAKLGQLYLDDGILPDGERILPEGWLEYASTPSGPQPGRGCIGYGAGWWLFNSCDGIPADTIAAMGNRGQYVVVVPSRDVVIVRRGEDPAGGSGFDIISFTRDVLEALED